MKRFIGSLLLFLAMLYFFAAALQILRMIIHPHAIETDGLAFLIGLFIPTILCLVVRARLLRKTEIHQPSLNAQQKSNLVLLTPKAVEFAAAEIQRRGYSTDAALRVRYNVDNSPEIVFDFVSDDIDDWVDDSQGVNIIAERKIADRLRGYSIDVSDEKFHLIAPDRNN